MSPRSGGAIMLVVSLAYGLGALEIPVLPADALEPMSARSLPLAIAALGVCLSVALLVRGLPVHADVLREIGARTVVRVVGLVLICLLYAVLIPGLGFAVASTLCLSGCMVVLGVRSVGTLVGVPLVVVATLWLVLTQGLGVYLPSGVWIG